ncbi:MAG: hypothetical protein Q8878_10110 [Bacillota bacterium]|nr:hypothetical protein [Bacillota bacterium]
MLGKLLKYEFRATGRVFLPLYGALVVFALIAKILNIGGNFKTVHNVPAVISLVAFVSIIVAIFVITFVMMIQRFQKNLLSDEGYLMFTLPVKPWAHITSKLTVSVVWIIASMFVTAVSIVLMVATRDFWIELPRAFMQLVNIIGREFGASEYTFVLEFLIMAFAQLILGILMIYASISLGHLFSRHRMLWSVGAFLALSTVTQTIVMTVVNIIEKTNPGFFSKFILPTATGHFLLLLGILANLVFAAAFFAITNYVLKNRLNLE